MRLQFRRAVDEDESASDWDDLSPSGSPRADLTASPEVQSPFSPHGFSSASIPSQPQAQGLGQVPLVIDDNVMNASQKPTLHLSSLKKSSSPNDVLGPPQSAIEISPTPPSPPHPTQLALPMVLVTESTRTGEVELPGLNGTSKENVFRTHSSDSLPRRETQFASEGEREFDVQIAGVLTPHPPPVGRSHDHRSVYKVGGSHERRLEEVRKAEVEGGRGGIEIEDRAAERNVTGCGDDMDHTRQVVHMNRY